jgi:hypothetical protein
MGITSSAAAAANILDPNSHSVGYAENATMPLGPYTTFRGQPVDSTSILMAFTRTGDANLDGLVNDDDVTIVGATYLPGLPNPHWGLGDFDYNGFVDDDDVTLLGVFYDPLAPPLAVSPVESAASVAAVPEPSTLVFLAASAVLVPVMLRFRGGAVERAVINSLFETRDGEGTGSFCSADWAELGQSPAVFGRFDARGSTGRGKPHECGWRRLLAIWSLGVNARG